MKLRKLLVSFIAVVPFSAFSRNTDTYIKLADSHGKHPRVDMITFPGDADNLDMYNSIYGHGGVLENSHAAFRVYMDNRQSIDVYLKPQPRLELDRTGFYSTVEMVDSGYGCDVLWAGKSIAAGSFRGFSAGGPVTIDTVMTRSQAVIDRSTLEVVDKGWMFNNHPVDMVQRYSVSDSSRMLTVEILLDGYTGNDIFCTGIQKLEDSNTGFLDPRGYTASWGSNVPDKSQPEWKETVGLAVWADPRYVVGVKEDELNYLILLKPDSEGRITYRIDVTGGRENGPFDNCDKWFDYVKSIGSR